MSRGTFVLGTGAQKAGTTWLSDHLAGSPQYDPGFRKEYHVFDVLDLASESWLRRRAATLARDTANAALTGGRADPDVLHLLAMTLDVERYFDHFAWLLERDQHVVATGDLTPAYAMLPPERLQAIRAGFAARDVDTVAVFLMRDPVDRIWSQVRMRVHRQPEAFDVPAAEVLLRTHAKPLYALRTQYQHTLDALDAVFDAQHRHVGLYETLFVDRTQVDAIMGLCGLDPVDPRLDRISNAAPPAPELPEATLRAVATTYAEVYREVARRRPELDIERWWPHARYV